MTAVCKMNYRGNDKAEKSIRIVLQSEGNGSLNMGSKIRQMRDTTEVKSR